MLNMGKGPEFYKDDEPAAKVAAAFKQGEKGLTASVSGHWYA
jgi:hypothetical protein